MHLIIQFLLSLCATRERALAAELQHARIDLLEVDHELQRLADAHAELMLRRKRVLRRIGLLQVDLATAQSQVTA